MKRANIANTFAITVATALAMGNRGFRVLGYMGLSNQCIAVGRATDLRNCLQSAHQIGHGLAQ